MLKLQLLKQLFWLGFGELYEVCRCVCNNCNIEFHMWSYCLSWLFIDASCGWQEAGFAITFIRLIDMADVNCTFSTEVVLIKVMYFVFKIQLSDFQVLSTSHCHVGSCKLHVLTPGLLHLSMFVTLNVKFVSFNDSGSKKLNPQPDLFLLSLPTLLSVQGINLVFLYC
jgi:hypothetical protein